MADPGPNKKRIAQLFRMLGSSGGERRNAFAALERAMQSEGVSWTDIGDAIEHKRDDSKYTEAELQEYGQAMREEGVEAGIKIGMARASNGGGNGRVVLPDPLQVAEYCNSRLNRMKDAAQRNFVSEMHAQIRGGMNVKAGSRKAGSFGYLVSLYMKHGGQYQS